ADAVHPTAGQLVGGDPVVDAQHVRIGGGTAVRLGLRDVAEVPADLRPEVVHLPVRGLDPDQVALGLDARHGAVAEVLREHLARRVAQFAFPDAGHVRRPPVGYEPALRRISPSMGTLRPGTRVLPGSPQPALRPGTGRAALLTAEQI